MSETTNIENNITEGIEIKPYEFRKLNSTDMFPMFTIISKIGINEFTNCFQKDAVKRAIAGVMKNMEDPNADKNEDEDTAIVGLSVALEAANVVLGNMHKCENDIYKLLAQTSNLSVEEIKALDFAIFAEMIIDFIKKEEFKGFLKVVSRLFK